MDRTIRELRREKEELERELEIARKKQTEIREKASRIRAGIKPERGVGLSSELSELMEELEKLTLQREVLSLQTRRAQMIAEAQTEIQRLQEEIERANSRLQEPLSLTILAPVAGQVVKRGETLKIEWTSSGPIGERLRIDLLKRGIHLRSISFGAPNTGSFSWSIPREVPPASDYQIAISDPESGRAAVSDYWEVQ